MTQIITTTPAELEQLIQKSVRKVLLEEKGNRDLNSDDVIFAVEEAARYLKTAKQTLYGYTSKHLIPFIKSGKKLLFRKSDLDKWLDQNRQKSISEIKKEMEDGHE